MKNRILLIFCSMFLYSNLSLAASPCCCNQGGINYCDSSAGHYVCKDGGYSQCLCTNKAITTAFQQVIKGCCLWHGGVFKEDNNNIICNDGTVSPICSIQEVQFGESYY